MLIKWSIQFIVAFPLVIIVGLFPGNSIVEKAFSQNRIDTSQIVTPQLVPPQTVFPFFPADLCTTFPPGVFRELCEQFELENLPAIEGINTENLFTLTKAAETPVEIFRNPDVFREITKDPEKLARRLGFESVEHLAQVQPGACLIVAWVGIKPLTQYKDGDDPKKILRFSNSVILPLNDKTVLDESKDAKSSLTLTLSGKVNKWRWTGRGLPNFIRKIDEYGSNHTAQKLVVEIPGLNLRFLGVGQGSQLKLIPFRNIKISTLELKAGHPLPANEVFTGLVPEAKKILESSAELQTGVGGRDLVH